MAKEKVCIPCALDAQHSTAPRSGTFVSSDAGSAFVSGIAAGVGDKAWETVDGFCDRHLLAFGRLTRATSEGG